jgi:hypothetical protein
MAKAIRIVSLVAVLSLVLLAIALPLANAGANSYPSHVWVAPPPAGNNSNPGTEDQPFATIQKGINSVAKDGTVHVAAGTYHENLNISGAVNLTGAGAQNTIINGDGSGRVIYISSAPDTRNIITGFTIRNGCYTSSLWNPADEQVLFAGINLDFIKLLPQPFFIPHDGGGIYIGDTHIVTLNDCVIKDNQADRGGGIYNEGLLRMNRCTVSGNSAIYYGGGIYSDSSGPGGAMWLTNCTISGNSASEGGGGIYNNAWAGMSSVYSTIANNQATGASAKGGGFNNWGQATFESTIVANNTAGEAAYNNGFTEPAQGGVTTSLGNNLCGDNSCGFDQSTDLPNTDPLLDPLQDNGGPTFTHALLHGSPAIDAGNNTGAPDTDQRGTPRPQGTTCDIGAYELTQSSVTTATGTGTASFSTLKGYITGLTALDESALTCPPIIDIDFPNGLFSFTVTDITPGSSVTIVIILPSAVPTNTQYWKCLNGQWVDCTSLLGSNDGDSVLTLTITDGGLGDLDGIVNGEISDPGGPAVAVAVATPGASGALAGPGVSPTIPRPLNPSQMSLQYLSITPQQTSANQPITITTNVVNTGDEAGNINVTLKINGQVEQSRMVSVGPQGTQPVKFTVTKAQPGTYNVDILGKSGSFTILGANGSTSGSSGNRGLIVLLIIGVLVLATVVVLILSRRPV